MKYSHIIHDSDTSKSSTPKSSILKRFCPKNYAVAGIFNSSKSKKNQQKEISLHESLKMKRGKQ